MPGGCAGRGWDGGPSASWAAALALPLPRDSPLPRGRGRPRMPLALRGIPARPGRGSDVGEQAWRGGHRGRGVCASRSCLRSPLRTQGRLGRTQWPKPRAVATGQSHGCGVAGGPFPDIPPLLFRGLLEGLSQPRASSRSGGHSGQMPRGAGGDSGGGWKRLGDTGAPQALQVTGLRAGQVGPGAGAWERPAGEGFFCGPGVRKEGPGHLG